MILSSCFNNRKGIMKALFTHLTEQLPLSAARNVPDDHDFLEELNLIGLRERLDRILSTLTEREADVLKIRYYEGFNYRETGVIFGLSKNRIMQVEAKALRKLRHPTRLRKLDGFLEIHY